ncbi:MAG: thymidine phosphorylase [Planctomycetes bacterium]|nr:thymidine phosphorylase [Planctomycetota bacterium]
MAMRDWIEAKKAGKALSDADIRAFVAGVTDGSIEDAQIGAWLMAVCWRGMTTEETTTLTQAMIASGRTLEWSGVPGSRVDKHSTGGVGDKISLPLLPAVAACGGQVPMISGRALGHTGGTLDKLESIPRFRTDLALDALIAQTKRLGGAFGAATDDLAPADRRLYRLRDATATVASIPLITASILSKKAAEGLDGLVLDVKCGGGAFLSGRDDARNLALSLINTAERLGLKSVALLTDMSQPLGRTIGNALEIAESIDVLKGQGPDDVVGLVIEQGGEMLVLCGAAPDLDAGRRKIAAALSDGSALAAFRRIVEAQGGDVGVLDDPGRLPRAKHTQRFVAEEPGFVRGFDCRALGIVATKLGAGREAQNDRVLPGVGLVLSKKVGDPIAKGEPWVEAHFDDAARLDAVKDTLTQAISISKRRTFPGPLVLERIPGQRWRL